MMNNFNAEDYRRPGETDSYWELKKEFIEMYKYIFDEEKLLCLAQAYCDIVLKKSRYPDPVVKVITELSKPLKMCGRFLENNGNPSLKRPINDQQKDLEEVNSIYKYSERPFKQMKFLSNEEQSNSQHVSTSTALQPSVEHLRNTLSVPLCNKPGTQIFSKSDQVLKTAVEHSEKSYKQINFSANEKHTSSVFLPVLTDRLQPSVEQFSNACSKPLYNEQGAQSLSIPEQTFKVPVEYSEKSLKQKNFCDGERQLSQTFLSTLTDVFFPLVEQFQNISSVVLAKNQGVQSFSKSEQAFKAPVEPIERLFKQMDFWPNKKQSTSTCLPSSTNVLQQSVEQLKNTYSISSYNEVSSLSLSKPEQTFKVATEDSERPQKQKQNSATKGLLSSTLMPIPINVQQSSVEQFGNTYSEPFSNEQGVRILSKSEEAVKTPYCDVKEELEPVSQVKGIPIEEENGDRIIKALGLPCIKEFAEVVKYCAHKYNTPLQIIHHVSKLCNFVKEYRFEIDPDPDINTKFYTKCFLNDCLIASVATFYKNKAVKAKLLSAETAINTLIKLANGERSNSLKKHKHPVHRITDNKKIFKMFSKNINRTKDEPGIVTLKNIASLLDMEDCLAFNVTSNIVSETETEYTCKCFLNEILVSYATDESIQSAKNVAAELGLIKLTNLADYEIHKGELKKVMSHKNKSLHSVTSYSKNAKNNLEKPFILNKALFSSSMRDGLVFIERDRYKINVQKLLRSFVSMAANFCQKDFFLTAEEVPGEPQYKKGQVCIGGKEVGVGLAFTEDEAKTIASTRAYINLKRKYYTLRFKDEYIEGFLVTRDQMFHHEPYTKHVLKKDFIRCKKLKQNVWLLDMPKKDFYNCVERRTMHTSSKGTGFIKGNRTDLKRQLENMLKRFKESEDYCDLLFSDDFSASENHLISMLAKKIGLRSQSLCLDNNKKCVCLSHRYEIRKLLDYLVRNGGSNCKFEMLDESVTVI